MRDPLIIFTICLNLKIETFLSAGLCVYLKNLKILLAARNFQDNTFLMAIMQGPNCHVAHTALSAESPRKVEFSEHITNSKICMRFLFRTKGEMQMVLGVFST